MKEMCFQPFLENIKDSAAWIELGRSFHQEGTSLRGPIVQKSLLEAV